MTAHDLPVLTLHRYFIWANRMRVHFDEVVRRGPDEVEHYELETFLYLSYWYAATYVVVEGWKDCNLSDEAVDDLLESPNVALLKKYRHGVFHFRSQYFDEERFAPLITEGKNVVEWIRSLMVALSLFFLKEIKRISGNP